MSKGTKHPVIKAVTVEDARAEEICRVLQQAHLNAAKATREGEDVSTWLLAQLDAHMIGLLGVLGTIHSTGLAIEKAEIDSLHWIFAFLAAAEEEKRTNS